MTLNELVFDVLETVRGNHIIDDVEIDERQVKALWNQQRALWLRQEYNKPGRLIDENVVQDLGCLELEVADPADCCEVETGCTVLRTKNVIPKTIEFHDGTGITRVGPVNKVKYPFSFVTYDQAIYAGNGKYNKTAIFAYLLNGRIYLKTSTAIAILMEHINVRGVFENPKDASQFVTCDNKPCYSDDDQYPINAWMIPFMKERVIQQLLMGLQIPKDDSNDANENLVK